MEDRPALAFLVDEQMSEGLVAHFRREGFKAWHVRQVGLGERSDTSIFGQALERRYVIVTKDHDFIELSKRKGGGFQILWIRLGNLTTAALWRQLSPLLPEIVRQLERGEPLIEVID